MKRLEGLVAVSWGPDRIDLFWVGADRSLMHRWWDGSAWSADRSLGGSLASSPAVTTWAAGQMEVFAIFADGELWDRYWDGEAWHKWESLGGELTGQPAASSWSADRLDVFAEGRDGRLWHRWWNGSEWVPWQLDLNSAPMRPNPPRMVTVVLAVALMVIGLALVFFQGQTIDIVRDLGLPNDVQRQPSNWRASRSWRGRRSSPRRCC